MTTFISLINTLVSFLVDLIEWPLGFLPPFWSLLLISLLTSFLILSVFDKISNQKKMKRVKNLLRAHILSIRMFNEYLSVFLKIQGHLFKDLFLYLRLNLVPFLFLMVPMFLVLAQLNLRYAHRPLLVNESTLVKLNFSVPPNIAKMNSVRLQTDSGILVETKPVRIPSEGEIAWRIRPLETGQHTLTFFVDERSIEKRLIVGEGRNKVASIRSSRILDLLLYPGEKPIPAELGIRSVAIRYPDLEISIWDHPINWLVLFLIGTLVFTFLFKGLFDVEV